MFYDAGPTRYALYWQLSELGVACEVVAPTLVPVKTGDRVKTDRRDAEKLARCYRAGDLTAVWVPDAAHEALRDLVRARLAAKHDQLRARHRLGKFLLRHGQRAPEGVGAWSGRYLDWVRSKVAFEQSLPTLPATMRAVIDGLQSLRGVAKVSAVSKAGNAHLRRIVVEAAWSYRHRPAVGAVLAVRPDPDASPPHVSIIEHQ